MKRRNANDPDATPTPIPRRGSVVQTPDGMGKVIGTELRKNTNGGPGTWQARVQLDDGRIRHYTANALSEEVSWAPAGWKP